LIWVVVFLVVGVVLAIAAAFVFREAARMRAEPPEAIFDPDDAYEWVVAHLDDLVAATLTPDDVRRILDFQLEFLQQRGVSRNGRGGTVHGGALFRTDETVAYIVERAAATGEAYIPEQVQGVVDCQIEYLRFIGALGRPAAPGEGPDEVVRTCMINPGPWRCAAARPGPSLSGPPGGIPPLRRRREGREPVPPEPPRASVPRARRRGAPVRVPRVARA